MTVKAERLHNASMCRGIYESIYIGRLAVWRRSYRVMDVRLVVAHFVYRRVVLMSLSREDHENHITRSQTAMEF